jgi:putative DNA primase/helicase
MIKIRELAAGKGRYILQSMGFPTEYMQKKHRDCPLNGCGGKDRYRFTDFQGNGSFICSTCTPEGGDFVKLAMEYFGFSFIEVVKITKDILGIDEDKKMSWQPTANNAAYQEQKKLELERQKNCEFIDSKEREFLPVTHGDPVWLYLRSRGITIIPKTIRYHPAYFQDGIYHPCLVARLDNGILESNNRYQRVSWKQIFLTPDGKKANVTAVKKCMPIERDFNGCSIKLVDYYAQSGRLAVCEGIEKALQHYERTKIPTWSLDNAGNMPKWGCPKTVRELIIIADMDDSFKGQAAAYDLAEKSSKLIGKQGYLLETVAVKLFLRFQADWEEIIDNGIKSDYEHYFLQPSDF